MDIPKPPMNTLDAHYFGYQNNCDNLQLLGKNLKVYFLTKTQHDLEPKNDPFSRGK